MSKNQNIFSKSQKILKIQIFFKNQTIFKESKNFQGSNFFEKYKKIHYNQKLKKKDSICLKKSKKFQIIL